MSDSRTPTIDQLLMQLPAESANLAVIRGAVVAEGIRLGMDEVGLADLTTAVSEACANVVLHAYEDRAHAGPIELELTPDEGGVTVVVRDHGAGMGPYDPAAEPRLRLGLMLIGALSRRFVLTSSRGSGTEVRIQVPLTAAG